MKIIFFDLDGTLLRSHNGHVAFNHAILKTFGFPGDIRTVRPDGKTDPEILEDIFDVAKQKIEWQRQHWQRFSDYLEECYRHAIANGHTRVLALPGVSELVSELSRREDIAQGVVTGKGYWSQSRKNQFASLSPARLNPKGCEGCIRGS